MQEEAKRQREPISISRIRDIVKEIASDAYDKMIVSDDQEVKRADIVYVKMSYRKIERTALKVRFPLHGAVIDNFTELQGGEPKFGLKAPMRSGKILDILRQSYGIEPEEFDISNEAGIFDYPLDEDNGELAAEQRMYFLPDKTYQETCPDCKGDKYAPCPEPECKGRHSWRCTDCHGEGKKPCKTCAGDGKIGCPDCKGHGYVKCAKGMGAIIGLASGCGGSGYLDEKPKEGMPETDRKVCPKCHGKGEVPCKNCSTTGQIRCRNCSGSGALSCKTCSGAGDITCTVCYGDHDRLGKVDCPTCKTIGTMAQIVFVKTEVIDDQYEKLIPGQEKVDIKKETILRQADIKNRGNTVYEKVNGEVRTSYDEYSKEYAAMIEEELGLKTGGFPQLVREEIYYQVIPCVELSFRHALTNTEHRFSLIDFWTDPKIKFHSNPEELKADVGDAVKHVGGFFSRIFSTKEHKKKEDHFKELVLLIYLAKADGIIDEQEKIYLSENIGNLNDFTNAEKQRLFDLMNAAVLPELTKEDVTFSSSERADEVLNRMEELAKADGVFDPSEEALIDKVRRMM